MKLLLGSALVLGGVALIARGSGWLAPRSEPPQSQAVAHGDDGERLGPGPEPVDLWNPERATKVEPAFGGALTVHIESLPPSLNVALLNNTNARNMLLELHATLVRRDWESWKLVPELATGWEVADTLVLKDGTRRYGSVQEDGARFVVDLVQPSGTPNAGARNAVPPATFARDQVERVEHGTVFTFHLRPGVQWHDGHPFDAEDVLFSWRIAQNPGVRCDWVRPYLTKITSAEALDAHTVRFTFGEQYFNSLAMFADNFCILPRHLYDLLDPDHPHHDADASAEACAKEVNENVHNTQWIGLGPYRLTKYSQQGVEAERFDGFFDPEQGGYLDRITWRHIADDKAAFQALLNGELDFTLRISSDQYFGEATAQELFAHRYCKGYYYLGAFNYIPWNLRRPKLADLRVRQALAHAMDMDSFVQTVAHGLAKLPTGPQCYFGPAYDHDVKRLGFDLPKAEELLAAAGWYDRDGDGVVDKDGQPLEIEMIIQSGNTAADTFARMYQEKLARVGVRLKITPLDNATYFQRIADRDFDAGMQGWSVDVTENDPMQLWHSKSAVKGGSNHAGVIDPKVDALIERGQRELDDEKRWALWRELHRYLYEEVQPYLYREAPPRKFALTKAVRGVQFFKITPGYSLRRWYYPAGTPGTRATRDPR